MPNDRESLLSGRNSRPLTDHEIRRVANTIIGLDREVSFRYVQNERTRCRVYVEEEQEVCEIVFGPDIYPGTGVVDPNASLSMRAAAAHELSHFHRWQDKTELPHGEMTHIDEALTSLDAIQRFHAALSVVEVRQLVADATQRLQLHAQQTQDERPRLIAAPAVGGMEG